MQATDPQENEPPDPHKPDRLETPPLLQHAISKSIWIIAWPGMVMTLMQTINSFMDRFFVGGLGPAALAATGVGGHLMFLNMTVAMAISMGATAIVARMVGARDFDTMYHAARQSFGLSLVLGAVISVLAFMFLPHALTWFNLKPDANRLAHEFITPALWGVPAMFVMFGVSGTFRGLGNTRPPMYANVVANLVHVAGAWTLIYGRHGFPKMGVAGAGAAMAASMWVGAAMLWAQQWLSEHRRAAVPELPNREWIQRIMRIGVPSSIRSLIFVTSGSVFTGLLAQTVQSTNAIAAMQIGLTAEAIAFMPGFQFAIAASALVGQCLGAKDEKRAEKSGWTASWMACGVMTAVAILFFIFADPFARIFTKDPEVIALAVSYLRINAITEPLLAFGMVLSGALQGAGDVKKPLLSTFLTQLVLRVPLTYLLAFGLNLQTNGAWIAMSITSAASGLTMIYLFSKGSWKKAKV